MMDSIFFRRAALVLTAILLDAAFGDPHGWWHPVQGVGWVITKTERVLWKCFRLPEEREEGRGRKIFAGFVLVIVVLCVSVMLPVLVIRAAEKLFRPLAFLLSVLLAGRLLAMRSLREESMKVYERLRAGDIEGARRALSMIVGRDTERLDVQGIIRAAVETVAENTSDGVIAPLLFLMVGGIPGICFYKAANTMDSMAGYRNDRYMYFGRAAARLDDLLNLLPSRVSAISMILTAGLCGGNSREAMRIWKRDRLNHPSPNSAQTEAACAGALGIQLGGDARYFGVLHKKKTIGDPLREAEEEDIRRANRLMTAASLLVAAAGAGIMLLM